MTRGSIYQENITMLNINALNTSALKCVKQKLIALKGEIDKSTNILGDFNNSSNDWENE